MRQMPKLSLLREGAKRRYDHHLREVRALLTDADSEHQRGNHGGAANKLEASLIAVSSAAGAARELELLYAIEE